MNNKIIKANIFKANVTDKTNWLFLKLENELGNFGWGEATLQGKEKEIFERNDATHVPRFGAPAQQVVRVYTRKRES